MAPRHAAIGSAVFFLLGPGLEIGVGPALLTGGFQRGDAVPLQPVATAVGAVLVVVGLITLVRCFARFAREGRGTPTPAAPTAALVTDGPYRRSRNPQQLATVGVLLGEGLVLARPVLFAAAAAYLLTLHVLIVRYEEPRLRARFGAAYDVYRERVPRWLPRRRGRTIEPRADGQSSIGAS
ncbi:isoprenylcysteine carboxylmethyltransferase family protein [Paraconexibacter sp.]|uniref:methyltransferase family protein n=1 Tax=Paraconexibacter sp. TaxID=2949640 RepID=UPI003564A29E